MPDAATQLSPLRNTTSESQAHELAMEQAKHFGIDDQSEYGKALIELATNLYKSNVSVEELWHITTKSLAGLDRSDRIAWFNAKRFVSFQLAKILDTLQNPMRATYQSIVAHNNNGSAAKGVYPLFDNVTALFSANPVITRTATYLYACTEWVEDAFTGREPLHQIYSRLLNPTSISLANHIIDSECGLLANEYMAWNFNSGLAAIDGVLAHLLGHRDVLVVSRNIYGGTHQLIHDWYGKQSNLDIALQWVDGYDAESFETAVEAATEKFSARLTSGRKIYIYLESPCNPHGFVLDVAGISEIAHKRGWQVIADTTVGTPLLTPVLRNPDRMKRPDFVVHSYTKDLAGTGTTTAGVVIGRNEDMFIPKGDKIKVDNPDGTHREVSWDQTLFWNVYYVKGAFLDADKAFEVINGMKTFELRVIEKAINTIVLVNVLDAHEIFNVSSPALTSSPNYKNCQQHMFLGLPPSLFTFDLDGQTPGDAVSDSAFKRFFDMLEPAVGLQVSLGQTNTIALCPALTSHSELSEADLSDAGIKLSTIRVSVGLEDPRIFISHIQRAAEIAIEPEKPGFVDKFIGAEEIDELVKKTYVDVHTRFISSRPSFNTINQ